MNRDNYNKERPEVEKARNRAYKRQRSNEQRGRDIQKRRERRQNYGSHMRLSWQKVRNVYFYDACALGEQFHLTAAEGDKITKGEHLMTMVSFPLTFNFLLFIPRCLVSCKTEKGLPC